MGDISTWSAVQVALAFVAWAAVILVAIVIAWVLWTLAEMIRDGGC